MDFDMIRILHLLYQQGKVKDAVIRNILDCYPDTTEPLTETRVIRNHKNYWKLAPGVMDLLKRIDQNLDSFPPKNVLFSYPLTKALREKQTTLDCLLLMPYGPSWFRTVYNAIESAAKVENVKCLTAKDISQPGTIMDQVWQEIRKADLAIADLTGNNPNVLYEIGICHALGKDVILITQDLKELPFDLMSARNIEYSLSKLDTLTKEIAMTFNAKKEGFL